MSDNREIWRSFCKCFLTRYHNALAVWLLIFRFAVRLTITPLVLDIHLLFVPCVAEFIQTEKSHCRTLKIMSKVRHFETYCFPVTWCQNAQWYRWLSISNVCICVAVSLHSLPYVNHVIHDLFNQIVDSSYGQTTWNRDFLYCLGNLWIVNRVGIGTCTDCTMLYMLYM